MNIKEHIEAGHYPNDALGRPQVLGDDGCTWSIICTNKPYGNPVVGFRNSDGQIASFGLDQGPLSIRLLPPPPRKVKVKARLHIRDGWEYKISHLSRVDGGKFKEGQEVELTGEYEESWDA
jgi:hypothetical protein